jgi:DNA polymerase III delta subunit
MPFRIASPVVLSFGEEGFFLDRDLDHLSKYPGRDISILDGSEVTDDQVVSACETVSVDLDTGTVRPRLVIVDNIHKIKSEKRLKEYLGSKQKKDLFSVLAGISRTEKAPALWAKCGPGVVTLREHKKLKTWDDNNEVAKWASNEAKRLGFGLDLNCATALFRLTGGDLHRITNELNKLRLLVGNNGTADLHKIAMVASRSAGTDPWIVVDAALMKNKRAAMDGLNLLYRFAAEDPSISLLSSLMKGVEKLFVAVYMISKGRPAEEIASRLAMHPFRYQKTVQVQAAKHKAAALIQTMQKLSKLDVELKRTSHRRTLVELVVLEVAT